MKLHGIAPSNYYNVAKIGLLEKGLPFMEVRAMPSQEEAFLAISPMGKIPVLETDDGQFLSESQAILAYLELAYPNPPLYPADAMAAGRAQQIHAIIDCYLDPPARRMISPAFFGGSATAEEVDASEKDIARVFAGLSGPASSKWDCRFVFNWQA